MLSSSHTAEVIDLLTMPVVMKISDMVLVYRNSESRIRSEVKRGICRPMPFAYRPLRWRRSDVIADLESRQEDQSRSIHRLHLTATAAR